MYSSGCVNAPYPNLANIYCLPPSEWFQAENSKKMSYVDIKSKNIKQYFIYINLWKNIYVLPLLLMHIHWMCLQWTVTTLVKWRLSNTRSILCGIMMDCVTQFICKESQRSSIGVMEVIPRLICDSTFYDRKSMMENARCNKKHLVGRGWILPEVRKIQYERCT